MPKNEQRKYTNVVDYVQDSIGADVSRDVIKVAIAAQDLSSLDINLDEIGGKNQSSGDLLSVLESIGGDEIRVRVFDSNDNEVNPAGQVLENALSSNGTDEFRVELFDSAGNQVDPATAIQYPDNSVIGADLTTSDTVIGPVDVSKSQAVMVAVNDTTGGTLNVTVDWEDSNGNVFQTETASDLELSATTQDWARVVRKGSYVRVTLSNGNSATSTNAYVDAHR